MIKFFKKIRRKTLIENKFSKYFLYATGEIILVVIGILIALQVNSFSNNQQRIEVEKKILHEIVNNLNGDLVDVQDELESFITVTHSASILINHFQLKLPYNDSIGSHIHVFQASPHLSPARSGYKLLESKGIDLISNDSFRIQITNLYERSYPYYFTYTNERFQMIESIIQPFYTKHFYIEDYHKSLRKKRVPIDYELLLSDPSLTPILQTGLYHASVMVRKSTKLKAEIEALHKQIKTYLEMKKSNY